MAIKYINDSETKLPELKKTGKSLVVYTAPWCGPCKMMEPILEKLSEEMPITKVNIDEAPDLAKAENITSVPTLVFHDGFYTVGKREGYMPEAAIHEQFKSQKWEKPPVGLGLEEGK